MKKACNARSVFHLDYGDGTAFTSQPCEWLDEAIVQSGRSYPPIAATFDWSGTLTHCTAMGIIRSMQAASRHIQGPISA